MRPLVFLTLSICAALVPTTGRGDGLLYQLPADGTSARFDVELSAERGGMAQNFSGSLTMSSVGQTDVANEKCRWVEFVLKMNFEGQERTIVCKLLIPEKRLVKGEKPLEHVAKAWLKESEAEPDELKDLQGKRSGPLPVFLSGPLDDVKMLEKEVIENTLGKLECDGLTGRREFDQGNDRVKAAFETRLHKTAPFGVVNSRIKLEIERDGQPREKVSINLKLADVTKGAATALPNHK